MLENWSSRPFSHLWGLGARCELSKEVERLNCKCVELETELANVKAELDDYAATVDEFIKDHKRWLQKALTPNSALYFS